MDQQGALLNKRAGCIGCLGLLGIVWIAGFILQRVEGPSKGSREKARGTQQSQSSPVPASNLDDGLVKAVTSGDLTSVDNLISQGADVQSRDDQGLPALSIAAKRGNEAIVRRLLAAGASVDLSNPAGFTALSG